MLGYFSLFHCKYTFFVLFNPISWTELGCKVNDIKVKLSLQFTSSFCFDAESPAHDPALAHPEDKLRTALLAFFSLLIRSFQELGIVRHIYHCHTQFTSQRPALKLLPITSILSTPRPPPWLQCRPRGLTENFKVSVHCVLALALVPAPRLVLYCCCSGVNTGEYKCHCLLVLWPAANQWLIDTPHFQTSFRY